MTIIGMAKTTLGMPVSPSLGQIFKKSRQDNLKESNGEEPYEEDLSWILRQLPFDFKPLKIDPNICLYCDASLDIEKVKRTKFVDCPRAGKLFVWRDEPPEECPYCVEHIMQRVEAIE
jgi:predicted RNA-binding Zn-ribbon protein involved in translation (DUF1610 family)